MTQRTNIYENNLGINRAEAAVEMTVACPFCDTRHTIKTTGKPPYQAIECVERDSADRERGFGCGCPFVVGIVVEETNEVGRKGKTYFATTYEVKGFEPKPASVEAAHGEQQPACPRDVEQARAAEPVLRHAAISLSEFRPLCRAPVENSGDSRISLSSMFGEYNLSGGEIWCPACRELLDSNKPAARPPCAACADPNNRAYLEAGGKFYCSIKCAEDARAVCDYPPEGAAAARVFVHANNGSDKGVCGADGKVVSKRGFFRYVFQQEEQRCESCAASLEALGYDKIEPSVSAFRRAGGGIRTTVCPFCRAEAERLLPSAGSVGVFCAACQGQYSYNREGLNLKQ